MAIILYGILFPILVVYNTLAAIGVFCWAVVCQIIDWTYGPTIVRKKQIGCIKRFGRLGEYRG